MGSGVARRARQLAQHVWTNKRSRLVALLGALVAVAAIVVAVQGTLGGQSPAGIWDLSTPEVTDDGVEVQLSRAQQREAASATFAIVEQVSDGYYRVLTGIPAQVDAQGKASLPADPLVLSYVVNGMQEPTLMGGYCEVTKDDELHYRSDELRLSATADLSSIYAGGYDVVCLDATFDAEGMPTQKELTRANPPYPLGEVVQEDEMGLYTAAFYAWKSSLSKVRAEDGTIAPVSAWPGGGSMNPECMYCDEGIDFRLSPLSAFADRKFRVQLIVEDAEGNAHASDLSAVLGPYENAEAQKKTLEVETERGSMSFELGDTYATLASYTGEDARLEVPGEVEGLPVRAVGDQALRYNEYVKELVLPQEVCSVGGSAFCGSALSHVVLPAGLEHIGPAAFARLSNMTDFELDSKNKTFSVRDGVLFSADGKTLVAFPAGKGGTYAVPEGVTTIGYGAFAGFSLREVTLPASLREIGPYAFADCASLESLELPQGLERIGSGAFSSSVYAQVASVHMGPNVSYVGRDAFEGLAAQSFAVDAKNRWYKSDGGFLLSRDGVLLQTPLGVYGEVVVPEGVTGLASQSLANILEGPDGSSLDHLGLDQAELYLPQSLEFIEEDALPATYEQGEFGGDAEKVIAVRIHTPKGSWAERYAQENGIAYDSYYESGNGGVRTKTITVPKAQMGFEVYADHAVLVSLEAQSAGHVEVPAKVDGVPVTTVGESDDDVANGEVKTLVLPESIEHIEGTLLHKLSSLRRISFEGNDTYAMQDGMIFSKDGTTLVACPAAYGEDVEVPEGTTEIGDYAFCDTVAASVTLPEGVERIGNFAFKSASNLTTINFPQSLRSIGAGAFEFAGLTGVELNEGLETIGKQAFYGEESYEGLSVPDSVRIIGYGAFASGVSMDEKCPSIGSERLHIGAGVEEMYDEMFCGLDIQGFDVDPQNTHFRAEGPFLLSANGSVLYACASGAEGEVTVPESVEEIVNSAFSKVPNVTDVYVTKDLMRVDIIMAFDVYTNTNLTLHCPEGSDLVDLAEEAGLPCSTF